jgi:hypothetical protein
MLRIWMTVLMTTITIRIKLQFHPYQRHHLNQELHLNLHFQLVIIDSIIKSCNCIYQMVTSDVREILYK